MANNAIILEKSKLRVDFKTIAQARGFADEALNRKLLNSATPDPLELDEKRGHLLFVHGSLKKPFPRHYLLHSAKAKFVAVGMTVMPYSLFYQHQRYDERLPILLPAIDGSPTGHVVGQLWVVYPQTIRDLDQMERDGKLYQRLRMQVQIVSKPLETDFQLFSNVWPWAYMGIPSAWRPLVQSKDMTAIPCSKFFDQTDKEIYINWSMKHALISSDLEMAM